MTDPTQPGPTAPMPALYLGHGAPPLLEDAVWMGQLNDWANALPRPSAILMISALSAVHAVDAPARPESRTRRQGRESLGNPRFQLERNRSAASPRTMRSPR